MQARISIRLFPAVLAVLLTASAVFASHYPLVIEDTGGRKVRVAKKPARIVSVSPSVTEVIVALGAGGLLVGRTYHSTFPAELNRLPVMGGFFRPSADAVRRAAPDIVFLSRFQKDLRKELEHGSITLVELDSRKMEDAYRVIGLAGRILDKEPEAARLVARIRARIALVRRKTAGIPRSERKRVMRLMGLKTIMTPGDDSFQNEFIRAAGGIPPVLGRKGAVVPMTPDEWRKFNPQLIYYCGNKWELSKKFFDKPGWKEVDAVRNKRFARFPCELTCRASTHMSDFVAWLSSVTYPDRYCSAEHSVTPDTLLGSEPVDLPLSYVKSARVVETRIRDFPNRTLLIDLSEPMKCVSTLEGPRDGIDTVANHSLPSTFWRCAHRFPIADLKEMVARVLRRDPDRSSFLFTGARMHSLSVEKRSYRDMTVYALVTAGVTSNAVRTGVDEGRYYEPGTINVIVLTNMRLSPRAMTRAIITATEAKAAAMQDLDVRSTATPAVQATGTGTDNVLVVEGRGPRIDNAGGHTKMGELIARAVHAGVKESIRKQNGLVPGRTVFQRLHERNLGVFRIVHLCPGLRASDSASLAKGLERLLMKPRYAGFLEQAFAVDDAQRRGLVSDLSAFRVQCEAIRDRVAGAPVRNPKRSLPEDAAPRVLRMALDALLNGLAAAPRGTKEQ